MSNINGERKEMNADEILNEIQRRCIGLQHRINDKSLDRFTRTELVNRCDVLEDLYCWIKDRINVNNRNDSPA